MAKFTLEQYLAKTSDEDLLNIFTELNSHLVPATGYSHAFCRKVNKMIDSGDMCINPTSYRKVYLPSLVKAVHKELANRYATKVLLGRMVV